MSKAYLRKVTDIASNTMTWLRRDEEVTLAVLREFAEHVTQTSKNIEFLSEEKNCDKHQKT